MKTAIVTGANGFVGHHLIKLLSENGYKIYAVVRSKDADASSIENINNVKIIYCEMAQIYSLRNLIKDRDIDYIYHLAWSGSSGLLRENYELQMKNVVWSGKLIEVAAQMSIKKIIIAGSVTQLMYREYLTEDEICPEMVTCYAIAKMSTEYLCKCLCSKYKIDLCWAYISNFYGKDDKTDNFINFLIENYSHNIVPDLTSAEQLADFTYVTDIAKGLMYACESGKNNCSYYVGFAHPRPLKEFIMEVKNIIAPTLESGIGKKNFNGKNIDFSKIEVSKLEKDTGFRADINFIDGIRKCCKREQ